MIKTNRIDAEKAFEKMMTHPSFPENSRQDIKILLAEDNLVNQKLILNILEKSGYKIDVVSNGLEAVKAFKTGNYSMIFMDVQMPLMNGFDATGKIRQIEIKQNNKRIVIIAMTAHAAEGYREHCINAGMDDYTSKPINPAALLELIKRWTCQEGGGVHPSMIETPSAIGKEEKSRVFDLEAALKMTRNNKEVLASILDDFCKDLDIKIEAIKVSSSTLDIEKLESLVHSLKGTSASVGAEIINDLCISIEPAIKKNEPIAVDELIMKLENEILAFKKIIQDIDWQQL